jgi:hypothetical protein
MSSSSSTQIVCSACGEESMLRREPLYDGFSKVGERLSCVSCGHEYGSEEEVPFKSVGRPKLFGDADRSRKVDIFSSEDDLRNCRHCRHYVMNPFSQRCNLHQREVDATDLCDRFEPPPRKQKQAGGDEPKDPLSNLFD